MQEDFREASGASSKEKSTDREAKYRNHAIDDQVKSTRLAI